MANLRRFLLYFAQEHIDFRYPEIRSLMKFFSIDIKLPAVDRRPYWILDADENDLRKIASRSVSLRFAVEIWSSGNSREAFHDSLKNFSKSIPQKLIDEPFRMTVETYNKHIKHHEKIELIESMDYLPLKGKIDLKNPVNNFIYFEFWGIDPANVTATPEEIVFGRWVK